MALSGRRPRAGRKCFRSTTRSRAIVVARLCTADVRYSSTHDSKVIRASLGSRHSPRLMSTSTVARNALAELLLWKVLVR